jgi:kinesin family protein 2/24
LYLAADGQTGSGKTYTMSAVYSAAAAALLEGAGALQLDVAIAFFEIYGGRCFDLLADRQQIKTLEDKHGEVQVSQRTHAHMPL